MSPLYSYCTHFLWFSQCSSGPGPWWIYPVVVLVLFALYAAWLFRKDV